MDGELMIHAQIVPESDIDYMFRNPPRSFLEPTPQQAATLPKREGEREVDRVFSELSGSLS